MDHSAPRISHILQVASIILLGFVLFVLLQRPPIYNMTTTQTVIHAFAAGGSVETERIENETLADWRGRHEDAVEAFE